MPSALGANYRLLFLTESVQNQMAARSMPVMLVRWRIFKMPVERRLFFQTCFAEGF